MFGLKQQIKLKRAKNALRDGRLDEAFAIVSENEIREYRGGQQLLEKLVDPLLDRAARHLEIGHLQNALLDVERAFEAGGNQPRVIELRQAVRDAIDTKKKKERQEQELVDSARNHLDKGSIHAGKEVLEKAPEELTRVGRLKRQADNRERAGLEAQHRAETFLERGEIEEALLAAKLAVDAHERDENLPELLISLKKEALNRLEKTLAEGNLRQACRLSDCLRPLFGDHLELRNLDDALSYSRKAAESIKRDTHEEARVALGRVQKLLPKTTWVEQGLKELDTVVEALRQLKTGPLGLLASEPGTGDSASPLHAAQTIVVPSTPAKTPRQQPPAQVKSRMLLWVDGIGTYLILTSDRISVGRAGSSACPDIALPADLRGHHAEILRIEDDYFIVPVQGTISMDGKEIKRKLLANNDRLDLAKNCRLTYHLPTPMSTTAMISLHKGQRIERDVRKVVLLDRDMLLGARGSCHIQVPVSGQPVVLSCRNGVIVCRSNEEISIDGRPYEEAGASHAGTSRRMVEVPVPLGAHMRVGQLSFTLTTPGGEGGHR